MKLSPEAENVIVQLAEGWTLKAHRYLDGRKEYRLHSLGDAAPQAVMARTVRQLQRRRLIHSNMKFPAASYLLTERGQAVAARLGSTDGDAGPLTSRNWF
jgi:DNA-binding HxlR family transcriptional regulator